MNRLKQNKNDSQEKINRKSLGKPSKIAFDLKDEAVCFGVLISGLADK